MSEGVYWNSLIIYITHVLHLTEAALFKEYKHVQETCSLGLSWIVLSTGQVENVSQTMHLVGGKPPFLMRTINQY